MLAKVPDRRNHEIPVRDRRRYRAVLVVICGYLREIGIAKLAVRELLELAQALDELDRGIARPFLRAAKAGSKVDPGDRWRARAYVAIAASILVKAGSERKTACERLAKDYKFLRKYIVAKNAKSFSGPIRSWLDRFEASTIKNRVARTIFGKRADLVDRWAQGKEWDDPAAMLTKKAMAEACGAVGCALTKEALAVLRPPGKAQL